MLPFEPDISPFFHYATGSFALRGCTYALVDACGEETSDLRQVALIRVITSAGATVRLRNPTDIRAFLAAVERPVTR